jgi:tetratricopeptide (TPR) repeat protein
MKGSFVPVLLFVLFISSAAYGQQAKLEGYVSDDKDNRVSAARIVAPGGQAAETDSQGHFTIAFPSHVQPGLATRIEVVKPNWVIYEPMLGNCVTQSSARNYEPLKVIIVSKGSPLALAPKRLSQVIARWANERAKLQSQVDKLSSQRDEYAFLKEYSEKYGFTLEQFVNAGQQWAQSKGSDDKEEQALKEYFLKNYDRAAQLAHESALVADEELERDNKKKIEDSLKVIRRFKLEGNALSEQYKFREALVAYNEIEKRFSTRKLSKEDLIDEWAETRLVLGLTKQELGIRVEGQESQLLLAESVKDYQEALTVNTRAQLPEQWAATQNNLGNVLQSQGERLEGAEGVRLLTHSVEAYREALNVQTREQLPQQWAMTQNNLGMVLSAQGERLEGAESMRLLAQSVEAYREALKVHSREQLPQQWAMTQNNLGIVLRSQGERLEGAEGVNLLAQSVEAYREALKVYTREQRPQEWATTQNNLGIVLQSQGERLEGAEAVKLLVQSVEAYREGLKVRTREQLPQDWAATQNNLGMVLSLRGVRLEGAEGVRLLAQSVEAFRGALKVYTREQLPQQWAATQNNLGMVLSSQGERLKGAKGVNLLAQSVEAYREALKVRTREQLPQQWAMTQNNLGTVLCSQGERLDGAEGVKLLAQSVEAFREALKVHSREQLPQQWAATQNNLGNVLRTQGERLERAEGMNLLTQAIEACREALKVRTREQLPQDWAMTQNNLGMVLSAQGERLEGAEGMKLQAQAVEAYRLALKVMTREQLPQLWVTTQNNLAGAYYLLRNWLGAAESYANVLTLYPDDEEAYSRLSAIYHEALFKFEEAFALNQQWLARHPDDISAQADFAERHFTTGRFAECGRRISALLTRPEVSVSVKTVLRAIEIANLLALGQSKQVPARMKALIAEVSSQAAEFKVTWSFDGTRHFIGKNEKPSPYRAWLGKLFDALAGKDREAILDALLQAGASFKEN